MHRQRTDEQLLAEFVKGDQAALGALARRYEAALLGLANGLIGGRAEMACDAVQETWVRVIRFAKQFGGRSSFKTWLYRIAVNQCRSLQTVRQLAEITEPADRDDKSDGPERAAEKTERNHALRCAVNRLDDDRRTVVLLCYHDGMTHESAAEILGIPLGTLKSRLHAALEELRSQLSAEDRS